LSIVADIQPFVHIADENTIADVSIRTILPGFWLFAFPAFCQAFATAAVCAINSIKRVIQVVYGVSLTVRDIVRNLTG
jgi:hypothetical protein